MLKCILLIAGTACATPDLVAPFTVDLISQQGALDTIIVTTYLTNIGNAETTVRTFDAQIVSIGIDSLNIRGHQIPANKVLSPGGLVIYKDTIAMIPHPFSIFTWCDPLGSLGEGGGEVVNNVRTQGYNYYPQVIRDTVRVAVHDTVQYCKPTASRQPLAARAPQSFAVYSAAGQLIKACHD